MRCIPRAPGKITTQDLCERLRQAEFTVTLRTLQRDLNELSAVFPLTVDDRNKPFGWSWQRDAQSFDLPGLQLDEALMLTMVEQQLQNQLPPSTLAALTPYFQSAAKTLANTQTRGNAKAWLNKARTIPATQPLLAPVIAPVCQQTIYQALMCDQQLSLHYRKRAARQVTVYGTVHPLSVVQRGGVVYLVCLFADYQDIRFLPLHRVEKAEMLHLPSRVPKGFSIDAYIATGAFGVGAGDTISLTAIFSAAAGEHLLESRLSTDQTVTELDDGRLTLRATVPNTKQLCWWLLGLGDGVEVIGPKALRQQMKESAERMHALYA
ncbi:WYL domain-containing protein [Actimicrobium antarcticum]|uniref:WYL domain-containing protein n=1 Tax=Actimicrobium antarcticum TaxID=1051899 RepID=A0ABP7TTI7_9BURK